MISNLKSNLVEIKYNNSTTHIIELTFINNIESLDTKVFLRRLKISSNDDQVNNFTNIIHIRDRIPIIMYEKPNSQIGFTMNYNDILSDIEVPQSLEIKIFDVTDNVVINKIAKLVDTNIEQGNIYIYQFAGTNNGSIEETFISNVSIIAYSFSNTTTFCQIGTDIKLPNQPFVNYQNFSTISFNNKFHYIDTCLKHISNKLNRLSNKAYNIIETSIRIGQ